MYKALKKTKLIWSYTEALAIHTVTLTVHWEDTTSCISMVEDKIVTPIVKQINIPVFFLQGNVYNGLFVPKYETSSAMLVYMCIKPCLGTIISQSDEWMDSFGSTHTVILSTINL